MQGPRQADGHRDKSLHPLLEAALAKYDPLQSYLIRRGSAELELAFEEIERLIGSRLPASASRPQWWANEADADTSHVQCKAWQAAGYDAFMLPQGRVLFRQRDD